MAELGQGVRKGGSSGLLHKMAVLKELELEEEASAVSEEIREMLRASKECAEGEAGDSVKYEQAAQVVKKRWLLFLGVRGYADSMQPTKEMVEEFTTFMFTTRQRRSKVGRTGLGDGAPLLARYTLAHKVFVELDYKGWSGLSRSDMKVKAQPFAEAIKETWTRLRRAYPQAQSAAKPFVKDKWDENAVFTVQDNVYRQMDTHEVTVNKGLSDLMVLALVRATCQRSGSLSKDNVDLAGKSVWGPEGMNVLNVGDITFSREGMRITLPDGTMEEGATRFEITINRVKRYFYEAAAGGYEYEMSGTPDAVAIPRRSADIVAMYLWRRGVFAVQYAGMSPTAVSEALKVRKSGSYEGGMPPGAVLSAEDAVARFNAGEKGLLSELEGEPLMVMLEHGGANAFTSREMTAHYVGEVFKRAAEDVGFKPGSGGVNCMRRSTMVAVQKNAEKQGFDPAMHAKHVVSHRSPGHQCREGTYEDATKTTDIGAFLMRRPVEEIEGLKNLSATRCPELAKYKKPSDVPKKDPTWKLLRTDDELRAYRRAAKKLEGLIEGAGKEGTTTTGDEVASVQAKLNMVEKEVCSLEKHLHERVLLAKKMEVYEQHQEALKTMPMEELQSLQEVNSFEGVSLPQLLLRYGCGLEVDFDAEYIVRSRTAKAKRGRKVHIQYLVKWRGYRTACNSWVAADNLPDDLLSAFKAVHDLVHDKEPITSEEATSAGGEKAPELMEHGAPVGLATPTKEATTLVTGLKLPSRMVTHEHEEGLASVYQALVKAGDLNKEAIMKEMAVQNSMPLATLKKKLYRAMKRLEEASMLLRFKFNGDHMSIAVHPGSTIAELQFRIAKLLERPASELRLCGDGERLSCKATAAAIVAKRLELEVFLEVRGGGGNSQGSQEDPVVLSPSATEVDVELPAPLSPGGTECDVGSPGGRAQMEGAGEGASSSTPVGAEESKEDDEPLIVKEVLNLIVAKSPAGEVIDLDSLDDERLKGRLNDLLAGLKRPRSAMACGSGAMPTADDQSSPKANRASGAAKPFVPNEKQAAADVALEQGKSVIVIGPAGAGKTRFLIMQVEKHLARDASCKVLVTAPYNTHVDKLRVDMVQTNPRLKLAMSTQGRLVLKTAAAAFAYPLKGLASAKTMQKVLNERTKELLREPNLLIIIDEAGLVPPLKRDETSEMLKLLRQSPKPDGGVKVLEVQDCFQGEPFMSDAEKEKVMVNGVPRIELNVEGEFIKDINREVIFFTESKRFIGPLKEVYEQGANELRGGGTGQKAQELVAYGRARTFSEAENLAAFTLYGTSKEVMDGSIEKTLARASARGQTVENGGVWIYDNPSEYQKYNEAQRNSLRPFGFERVVIAKGEKMLLIQKAGFGSGSGDDEEEEEEGEALRFSDKKFATGNMPCEVVDFLPGKWVKVKVETRPEGKNVLHVPVMFYEMGGVALRLIGLKPYMERVVDLAQGLETEAPVHVVAHRIFGRGKFYVAVTRCRDLRQLKITGVDDFDSLRRKVKSNWRAIDFYVQRGEARFLSMASKNFAAKEKEKFMNMAATK